MGRKHGDLKVSGSSVASSSSSSIALLQERFRQLQKMRERRERMKVLKAFSGSETLSDRSKYYEQARSLMVQPEVVVYHKPDVMERSSFQDSLSLGLDLYGEKNQKMEQRPLKTRTIRDFWSVDSVAVCMSRVQDEPDVDTSLHL